MNKKRILLVEDEITSSKSLSKNLVKYGYEVVSVMTKGEDVVKNVESLKPDLILMDINLAGEMDGIEAASLIQSKSDIPVIYITVFEDEKILQRALNTSPFSYLSKPVTDKELNNAIEIALHRHNLEKILKKHEKWLETLLKGIDDAVVITDDEGQISYLNPLAEKFTGWEMDEAFGIAHGEILNLRRDGSNRQTESPVVSALQYNVAIDIQPDTYLISKDGRRTYISGKAIPFYSDSGALSGVVVLLKEITERLKSIAEKKSDLENRFIERTAELMEENVGRKKAEESLHTSEEKYRKIVETSLEGIWLSDNNLRTTFVNRRMADLLGYTTEELLSTQLTVHLDEECKNLIINEFENRTFASGNPRELLFKRKDGEGLWALVSSTILLDDSGKSIGYLSMITDITERKIAEKEMLEAKKKAEESSKLKSVLIMNLNHELRTPMNGILGFASLLKDEISDPSHAEIMKDIYSSGERLMHTLNSIMEFAMLESGHSKPKIEEHNLRLAVLPVIDEFVSKAAEKDISFSVNAGKEDVMVNTDAEMLKAVVTNIVDNAIKFTECGGIALEFGVVKEDEAMRAVISVCDTGIGIPKDKQSVIFDEFQQASEGYGRSHEGIGLGLSIAKRISDLLDVRLHLDSSDSNGTIFKINIPAVRTLEREPEEPARPESGAISNKTKEDDIPADIKEILIVEDNKANVDLAIIFLKKIYKVAFAYTGEKAIEMAKVNKYSLILTDVNLGAGIDGIETQKRIRKIKGYEKIPNIVITGYSTPEDKERLLSEGFDDFISKPYTKILLIQAIQSQLKKMK